MLHLPMEPMNASAMSEGKSTVLTSMDDKRIMQLTGELINSLPGISGVNNHQAVRQRAMNAPCALF